MNQKSAYAILPMKVIEVEMITV